MWKKFNLIQWTLVRSFHYLWPGRVVVSERGRVWGQKFCDLFSWRSGGGEEFFLMHYFSELFFGERDITCIRTVVGPQQSHKGMLLKYAGGGVGGGQKFSYSVMGVGVGGDLFPMYSMYSWGAGQFFFGCNQYWQTTTSTTSGRKLWTLPKKADGIHTMNAWCTLIYSVGLRTVHFVIIKQIWQITINFMIRIIFIYFLCWFVFY